MGITFLSGPDQHIFEAGAAWSHPNQRSADPALAPTRCRSLWTHRFAMGAVSWMHWAVGGFGWERRVFSHQIPDCVTKLASRKEWTYVGLVARLESPPPFPSLYEMKRGIVKG